jgi:NADH:ubiquinone oxidoreductase subunit 6 (subunit J)
VLGVITAGLLLGIFTFLLGRLRDESLKPPAAASMQQAMLRASDGILAEKHMANLGRRLFSEQLIAVEIGGTLLLVALVGAVAIAMHGRPRLGERIEEALR